MGEKDTDQGVGTRLKAARKRAGMTQQQAADAIKSSLTSIQSWEAGKDGSWVQIVRLLRIYQDRCPEVSADEVFALNPRGLPAQKFLVDQPLYDRVMAMEEVDEDVGRKLNWVPTPVAIAFRIPTGAAVVEKQVARKMHRDLWKKLEQVCPASLHRWKSGLGVEFVDDGEEDGDGS